MAILLLRFFFLLVVSGRFFCYDSSSFLCRLMQLCDGALQKLTLRKHAYSNLLKISTPKTENFQIKNSDIFHVSAQNIDCGTR